MPFVNIINTNLLTEGRQKHYFRKHECTLEGGENTNHKGSTYEENQKRLPH